MTSVPPWLGRLRRIAVALVALLVVASAALLAWQRWAGMSEIEAASADLDRSWPVTASAPLQAPNEAALRIEQAVTALGLGLALSPTSQDSTQRPAELDGLITWLSREVEAEAMKAPPASLDQVLRSLAEPIAGLRAAIDQGAGARWPEGVPAGMVHLRMADHLRVVRLLLADAISADRAGDGERCRAAIASAWQLHEAIGDHRQMITQLVRVAEARLVAAVARDVDHLPPGFAEKLDAAPFRTAMRDAVLAEARETARHSRQRLRSALTLDGPEDDALVSWLLAPVSRRFAAQRVRDAMQFGSWIHDDESCGLRLERSHSEVSDNPGPAPFASVALRVDRLAVTFDLTRRVMALEQARDAVTPPAWPAEFPSGISDSCPCVTWTYHRPDAATARLDAGGWTAWLSDDVNVMATSWSGRLQGPPAAAP